MIKIVFFDIDGTLFSEKTLRVPPTALYSLKELQKKGIKIIAATGRGPSVAAFLEEETGLTFDGYISLNGQYCFTKNQVLRKQAIDKKELRLIRDYLEEKNFSYDLFGKDFTLRNKRSKKAEFSDLLLGEKASSFTYGPLEDPSKEVYQIKAYMPKEEDPLLKSFLQESRLLRWKSLYNAVFAKNGGKKRGVETFLEHYKIKKEDSLALGNGNNDLEFFDAVAYKVAMEDSPDPLKKKATIITASPDNEGIYKALLELKLLPQAELWEALYEDESPAGFYLARGVAIPKGYFHLVAEVLVSHTDGDYLLVRRAKEKRKLPGRWEASASGSALPGESSLEAAKREVQEETGIPRGNFRFLSKHTYPELGIIFHNYHCQTDVQKKSLRMQKGESEEYRWVNKEDFLAFMESDKAILWQRERLSSYLEEIKNR
ncbi:MAG TPA: Cof-type HAD-IIB family hydrolase [Clostridia bacterium]|nr:Cof-type HAD-IIB family hydrolase [Clostridia bacterium]